MKNRVETFEDYSVIYLPTGEGVMVDTEDLELLSCYRWRKIPGNSNRKKTNAYIGAYYAKDGDFLKPRNLLIHRLLLDAPKGIEVDHIDRNPFNNRRSNLRLATPSQNRFNAGPNIDSRTGLKGVTFNQKANRWYAMIQVNGSNKYLGSFQEKTQAALAYNEAAKELHGEFAYQNSIDK